MRFSTPFVVLFATFATALPAAEPVADPGAAAEAPPPAGSVRIEKVSVGGSGCPKDTVTAALSGDGQTMSLIFDDYIAFTGPGTTSKDQRKNCNVQVKLYYPQGWSYTMATTDYRGFISQEASCRTTLGSTHWFSGDQAQMSSAVSIAGAISANYLRTSQVATETLVWAKCGAVGPLFNANSQVFVTCAKKDDAGIATVDVQDTKFEIKYYVQWKKC